MIEKFDATPDIQDRESIIVKFEGGASLAGVGFDGQLLITEYGPIAASLSLSAGSVGVPLGPVTLFEAGALILFNEEVPELPENPLRLLDPPTGDDDDFNLRTIIDPTQLNQTMLLNARGFIAENKQREADGQDPLATWESPFLFAIDATIGATGVDRETFNATVTVGANLDLDPNNPQVVLFGLGEAEVSGLEVGTIGAVLDLSDVQTPQFQLVFQTPSPDSDLDDLPAEVKLGLNFEIEPDNSVRLDVFGEVTVLEKFELIAGGTLVLDSDGMYGGFNIFVGAARPDGTAESIPSEPTPLDLREIGIDVRLIAEFELLFNFTTTNKSFERNGESFEIAGESTRIYAEGMLEAGGFEISGAFLFESDPDGLLVAGSGQVLLGDLGDVTAEGGLKIESEQRDANDNLIRPGNAAGFFILGAGIGIDGILEIDGEVQLQFNTFAVPITFDVPRFNDDPITRTVDAGPFFSAKVSGRGGTGDARLSLFPREKPEDIRLFGVDFTGNFELLAQQDTLHLNFVFTASLTVANFDNAAIGSVSGNFDIVDGKVIGEFDGALTVAGITVRNGVTIDEFGCITLDEPILGISNFGCQPNIFVPDRTLLEDDPVLFTDPITGPSFGNGFRSPTTHRNLTASV